MTLLGMLRQTLGEQEVFHATQSRHLRGPLEPLLSRYAAVVGHFSLAQISAGLADSLFLFTFLRDPVERVLSLYGFYRHHSVGELDPEVTRAKRHDLKTILREQDPNKFSVWSNWQTFLLCGFEDCELPVATALKSAKQNLHRFDHIGFYEDLKRSLQILWARCGWTMPADIPTLNTTRVRSRVTELDEETLTLIKRHNAADQEVYDCARALTSTGGREMPTATISLPAASPAAHVWAERGTREIRLVAISVRGSDGVSAEGNVRFGDTVRLEIVGESDLDQSGVTVGVSITDETGMEIYGTNTFLLGQEIHVSVGQRFQVTFGFELVLAAGTYFLTAAIHTGNVHLQKCYHWIDNFGVMVCQMPQTQRFAGVVDLMASVHVSPSPEHQRR